jgi:signal transduction histidine kinase
VQKFQLTAEKRDLRLECRLFDKSARALGDIAMIETVLENLVENALRHIPESRWILVPILPGIVGPPKGLRYRDPAGL